MIARPQQAIGTSKPLLIKPSVRCLYSGIFGKVVADDGNSERAPRKSAATKAASNLHLALAAAAQPAAGSLCTTYKRPSTS